MVTPKNYDRSLAMTGDKCCNTVLEKQGWNVLRFWESDINNNQERVIQKLINVGLV